jgi:hypothetical protein
MKKAKQPQHISEVIAQWWLENSQLSTVSLALSIKKSNVNDNRKALPIINKTTFNF